MLDQITPLILTYNERENIVRTLTPLAWAREIVLVDSFSTDETLALARATHPNVRVLQRNFDSFAGQCNFGLEQIQSPWVLSLDADYELERELNAEIGGVGASDRGFGVSGELCILRLGPPVAEHPLSSPHHPLPA